MSGMGKNKNKRRASDYYPTPRHIVRQGLQWFMTLYPRPDGLVHQWDVLEPGCGPDHPFLIEVDVMSRDVPPMSRSGTLSGVELRLAPLSPATDTALIHYDTDFRLWDTHQRFDLICTNPPYSLAEEFVRKSVRLLKPTGRCLFLLRLSFLSSRQRYKLWTEDIQLLHAGVLSARPSFTGDGATDMAEYAWFVFCPMTPPRIYTRLDWLRPTERE